METQERTEREISLNEIFWKILLGWRQVICLALVCAVLLGGFKYVKDLRAYQAVKNTVSMEEAEKQLTEDEKEKVITAQELQKRIGEYDSYMETAAIMQVNPYAEEVVQLQYYVKSDYVFNFTQDVVHDYTDDITTMYRNYLAGGKVSQRIVDELGKDISQEDFSELLEVEQEGASIYVTIGGLEKEELEKSADILDSLMKEKETELQSIGSHELKLVDKSFNVIVNQELLDKRNNMLNTITALENQLTALKAGMTESQLRALENEREESGQPVVTTVQPGFSFKYVVLGLLAGIFLAGIWIVFKVLFSSKLQNSEEVRSQYGIRLLGEVAVPQQKKRFLAVIDNKLLALKNRSRKKLSLEQQLKIAAANIALSCKQQNAVCVYMTGSEYENMDAAVIAELKKELAAWEIQVKEGENIFYAAESLKQAAEVGYVLIVEQTNCSIYNEIFNELRIAREQQIEVLGAVVLN